MRPFLAALMLCSMTAHVVALAFPFQATALPQLEKVIVVSVCDPQMPKDQSRHVNSGLLPVIPVKTLSFVASDTAPAEQAADQRKPKPAKK